jgi:hypothetical protein
MCAAVSTVRHQYVLRSIYTYCVWRLSFAAVGIAGYQHGLGVFTVYGDCTFCSCMHNKISAWFRSMYCVRRLYRV